MMEKAKRVAIFSLDAKLPGETRGADRYTYIAERLVAAGMEVDFITSSFQHWTKSQRDKSARNLGEAGFNVVFIDEPGYRRNVGLARVNSHRVARANLIRYLSGAPRYDLVYSQIPPNNLSRVMAEHARRRQIPFIVDVNDLWPEAMYMAFDVPVLSKLLFSGFVRDARQTYRLASAVVGTSNEYADRPFLDRPRDIPRIVVYVGNSIEVFDAGAAAHAPSVCKPDDEFWVTYAGNLSTSYDIPTLIEAAALLDRRDLPRKVRVKVLGDGPARSAWEQLAAEKPGRVDFLGYLPFAEMAAYLSASDATINSLVKGAPQSIPTKIGDYLAAGHPMIDTSESGELISFIADRGLGIHVPPDDAPALARCIAGLVTEPMRCAEMGISARHVAETEFDRATSYSKIVDLVCSLA